MSEMIQVKVAHDPHAERPFVMTMNNGQRRDFWWFQAAADWVKARGGALGAKETERRWHETPDGEFVEYERTFRAGFIQSMVPAPVDYPVVCSSEMEPQPWDGTPVTQDWPPETVWNVFFREFGEKTVDMITVGAPDAATAVERARRWADGWGDDPDRFTWWTE